MSRVFLLLQNRENRRQLDALLSERYEIAPSRDLNEPFDLIIVDGPSFQQRQSELDQRKKSEDPLFLPLLLLAPSQDKRALTQRLWQYVDDVIVPPIEKVELLARIEMLLRTRQLSLNLEVHSRELQKRYEELDELRLVLEEKNTALEFLHEQKNQLLGMAAHDLRTPLGIVATYSQFLQQEAGETLSEEQRDFLSKIRSSSSFMRDLVDDLLDITHFAAGEMKLHLSSVNLATLVENNTALNRTLAAQKQIELTYRCSPNISIIRADETKLEQVLNNLIGNAIKFSHPSSAIEVSIDQGADHVIISVRDEGQGIPNEELDGIFDPFQTTSTRSTAFEKGTGLGLAIVRRIIEEHGGKVHAESEMGKGSTFYVVLPTFRVAQTAGPVPTPIAPTEQTPAYDREAALERYGTIGALNQAAANFIESYPPLLDSASSALAKGEARTLLRTSAKLSWHLGQLSAPVALEAALELENASRNGILTEAITPLNRLEREIQRLAQELRN